MARHEMPGRWEEKPAKPRPVKPWSFVQTVFGFLFLAALLAGGVWLYVQIGQHTELAGTLPLPKSLRTTSEANAELLLYGRSLDEVAIEAQGLLKASVPRNKPTALRLQQRIARLRETGNKLEPRLTREETRALIALQRGQRALSDAVALSWTPGSGFSTEDLAVARQQVQRGLALARGERFDDLVVTALRKAAPKAEGSTAVLREVGEAGAKMRLAE